MRECVYKGISQSHVAFNFEELKLCDFNLERWDLVVDHRGCSSRRVSRRHINAKQLVKIALSQKDYGGTIIALNGARRERWHRT
jgi:hypothetical protein